MANQAVLLLALAEAFATASSIAATPVDTRGNAAFRGLVEIHIERVEASNAVLANVGGGTVYGVDLAHKQNGALSAVQQFKGIDGATGKTVFTTTTDMPYAAFSNYNWIVFQNGVLLAQGAGAGKYQISDGTGKTIVTLGTAAGDNDLIEVYFVVPVAMYTFATTAITYKKTQVQGKEIMWYATDATASPSPTNVYVRPVGRVS